MWLGKWVVMCVIPLTLWVLLSGLDDLFIDLVYLLTRRKSFPWPTAGALAAAPEQRIAILVPLWREHRVIAQMLEHNLAAIRYSNYDWFVGVYPNDPATARAVAPLTAAHPRIHLTICPQDGPTSKGDCLNWIYRGMREFELLHQVRYDVIVTHDAEDVVHPDSLRLINWYSRRYAMVQVPVLPLPTGNAEWTHNLYCDEFAEFQMKDIPVRQLLGGFLPSNGVGTGFSRAALEHLAAEYQGRIFDPECLTEDYENGLRLYLLGYRQIFLPVRFTCGLPVATREYFPRRPAAAVRQRARWVTGIVLQTWQKHGWRVPCRQLYWFWRDRKGLVGNLLSPLTNLLFLYGGARYLAGAATGHPWQFGQAVPPVLLSLCQVTCCAAVAQVALRLYFSARIYGCRFAAVGLARAPWGNVVNCAATVCAVRQFVRARLRRSGLDWRKTEHMYPRPRLGEVLVRLRAAAAADVEDAAKHLPTGLRIGEYLLQIQRISEYNLYQALSIQFGFPAGVPDQGDIHRLATRTFPLEVANRWKVMPYRVESGQLHVLTASVPTRELVRELSRYSSLKMLFRLVRPGDLIKLAEAYWGLPIVPSSE